MNDEEAIEYVMDFYGISRETAITLYPDEIYAIQKMWALEDKVQSLEQQIKTK
jgi:hypothetical protein